ncbi:hypothetical protein BJV77DRAFT_1005698 [Russula vinacea]|nr:hypothetical protein BJV77DRAFT_1005698 [Russula vinacea]
MAQTRRSGRRSAPSGSTSASKSPDSPSSESAPRLPVVNRSSSSVSSRKRTKQEDNGNGRTKRKGKEKEKPVLNLAIDSIIAEGEQPDIIVELNVDPDAEEEEQGVTRCVCGNAGDDDESAGEFFVQCETCNVWQHGQCMGIRNEDAVKADHYFCEKCRPDLHVELLKRLAKRPRDRHPSTNSHPNTSSANRKSRSHSPTHQKPQKRRNTMNSRDAAYDELEMMALLVDSAAEAAAAVAVQSSPSPINGSVNGLADVDEQAPSPATAKKKRKRGSEDAASIKRTRSASTTSDRPAVPKPPHEDTPAATPKSISMPAPPVPPAKSGRSRPSAQAQDAASVDGDEGGGVQLGPSNRRSGGGRSRASGSRRNPNAGDQAARRPNGSAGSTSAPPASFSRTYSSSQQQQQPLSHRGGTRLPGTFGVNFAEQDATATAITWLCSLAWKTHERGRVGWTRAGGASERYRRREALKVALGNATSLGVLSLGDAGDMAMDGVPLSHRPPPSASMADEKVTESGIAILGKSTMKMMEELMEELIGFQERFGPVLS